MAVQSVAIPVFGDSDCSIKVESLPDLYLQGQVDTGEVGQDRDGRQGDQDGTNHVTRDPSRHHQQQRAGAVHHLLQVEGHTAGEETNQGTM